MMNTARSAFVLAFWTVILGCSTTTYGQQGPRIVIAPSFECSDFTRNDDGSWTSRVRIKNAGGMKNYTIQPDTRFVKGNIGDNDVDIASLLVEDCRLYRISFSDRDHAVDAAGRSPGNRLTAIVEIL